jgi:hypothetical protein
VRQHRVLTIALLAATAAIVTCAHVEAQAPAFGYAIVSPIAVNNIGPRSAAFAVGGGVEGWIRRDVTVGAELDNVFFPPAESHSACCASFAPAANAFLVTGNVSRYFARHRATTGFISGGMSVFAGKEPVGMFLWAAASNVG